MKGAPRQRLAASISPAAISARILVEETVSPPTSTSGTTLVLNSARAASISGSPWALAPKRKFSPTETRSAVSRSISTSSMKPWAERVANSRSKGMTTSSRTPSPSITSRFTANGMISFGSAAGWSTSSGWGSKVRTVSAPSITAWWPMWTPSKVPIATSRDRGFASGSDVTSMLIETPPRGPVRRLGPGLAPRRRPRPRRGRSRYAAKRSSKRPPASRSGCGRRCLRSIRSHTSR